MEPSRDNTGDTPVVVVNIVSTSYSGSTWLNLLLGAHPRMFCMGEVKDVQRDGRAVCQLHAEACPVWSAYRGNSGENPFAQIARLSGRRWLAGKNCESFGDAVRDPGVGVKLIHLVRDGRAVMASIMRKYADKTAWRAARQWSHEVRKSQRLLRAWPAEDVALVRYEDLVEDTRGQLLRLCGFLGLTFDPAMLTYWNADLHYLGGNRGTLHAMVRRGEASLPPDPREAREGFVKPEWDLGYYDKQNQGTIVDERWKHELSWGRRAVFGLVGGWLNHRHGYRLVTG